MPAAPRPCNDSLISHPVMLNDTEAVLKVMAAPPTTDVSFSGDDGGESGGNCFSNHLSQ